MIGLCSGTVRTLRDQLGPNSKIADQHMTLAYMAFFFFSVQLVLSLSISLHVPTLFGIFKCPSPALPLLHTFQPQDPLALRFLCSRLSQPHHHPHSCLSLLLSRTQWPPRTLPARMVAPPANTPQFYHLVLARFAASFTLAVLTY